MKERVSGALALHDSFSSIVPATLAIPLQSVCYFLFFGLSDGGTLQRVHLGFSSL